MSKTIVPQNQELHNRGRDGVDTLLSRYPALGSHALRGLLTDHLAQATKPETAICLQAGIAYCDELNRQPTADERHHAIRQAQETFLAAVKSGADYDTNQADFYDWLGENDPPLLQAIQSTWPSTFYSVAAAGGGGVMFCPVPPKRRGRRSR